MHIAMTNCCGLAEIDGVNDFGPTRDEREGFFDDLISGLYGMRHTRDWHWPTMILFTDARPPGTRALTAGDRFARYIEEKELGSVTSTHWEKNHNTNNNIKVWIWRTNTSRCEEFFRRAIKRYEEGRW